MRGVLIFVLFGSLVFGAISPVGAWQLARKEGGVCITYQTATIGSARMEIAYLPQAIYLIKFTHEGAIGERLVGSVAVQKGSNWTSYPVDLEVVSDAVMGSVAYSLYGMPDSLGAAIRAGSALRFDEGEYSLVGSSVALDEIVACVKGRE